MSQTDPARPLTAEEREQAAMDWADERRLRQYLVDAETDERFDLLDDDDRDRALGLGRWAR